MRLGIVEQLEGETVCMENSRQGRPEGGHCTVIRIFVSQRSQLNWTIRENWVNWK